jgi:hypothetical protein
VEGIEPPTRGLARKPLFTITPQTTVRVKSLFQHAKKARHQDRITPCATKAPAEIGSTAEHGARPEQDICSSTRSAACASARASETGDSHGHITPHRGDPALFWDSSNWRSLIRRLAWYFDHNEIRAKPQCARRDPRRIFQCDISLAPLIFINARSAFSGCAWLLLRGFSRWGAGVATASTRSFFGINSRQYVSGQQQDKGPDQGNVRS